MSDCVLVIGAGVSGMAAARLARRREMEVTIFDADEVALSQVAAEGFGTAGPEWSIGLADEADLVVVSPGVPPITDIYRDCGDRLISEIELAC